MINLNVKDLNKSNQKHITSIFFYFSNNRQDGRRWRTLPFYFVLSHLYVHLICVGYYILMFMMEMETKPEPYHLSCDIIHINLTANIGCVCVCAWCWRIEVYFFLGQPLVSPIPLSTSHFTPTAYTFFNFSPLFINNSAMQAHTNHSPSTLILLLLNGYGVWSHFIIASMRPLTMMKWAIIKSVITILLCFFFFFLLAKSSIMTF